MSARATTPTAADEALAYLRSVRARQINAGSLGRELPDGSVLFGAPITVYDPAADRRIEVLPLPTTNDRPWRLSSGQVGHDRGGDERQDEHQTDADPRPVSSEHGVTVAGATS